MEIFSFTDIEKSKLHLALCDALGVSNYPAEREDRARAEYARSIAFSEPMQHFYAAAVADLIQDQLFEIEEGVHIHGKDVSNAFAVDLPTSGQALRLLGFVEVRPGYFVSDTRAQTNRLVLNPLESIFDLY